MLDDKGFDLWADGYDADVHLTDESNMYPFAGYKTILGNIYNSIVGKPNSRVLDVGFGTGILAAKLYKQGHIIYGQDFSSKMVVSALTKMPNANLYQGDLIQGLVPQLKQQTYDFIVATYFIHHLTDTQKIVFLNELLDCLNVDGKIFIGDVAFETREELLKCRAENGDGWDDEEFYCVAKDLKLRFPNLSFQKISFCSGMLTITK